MKRFVRWRFILPYMILLLIMEVASGLLLTSRIRSAEDEKLGAEILAQATALAGQTSPYLTPPKAVATLQQLVQQNATLLGVEITLISPEGVVIASSVTPEKWGGEPLALPGVLEALEGLAASQVTRENIHNKTGQMATAAAPSKDDAGNINAVLFIQAANPNPYLQLAGFYWVLVIIFLTGMLLLFIIAHLISIFTFKPLEKLTQATQQIGSGNFTEVELPEFTPIEIHDLYLTLQEMAFQLGAQIKALTSERAKLTVVLTQMTDGVMITDADGSVQLLNPAAERLFQIRPFSGLGRSVVEVLRHHQLVALWRKTQEGQRQTITLEVGPKRLFLQVIGIPLKTALPGNSMLLFQDLTQLRRLEVVRRDFVSNVSHELRTPLASMKALAETLMEGALEDPPAARRFIIRMETEIDNLTHLVNELLELSRIESGKMTMEFQRVLPNKLVEPAIERMILQAERAGLTLTSTCAPDLPLVFADPARIAQVLINLIHNAVKFTPPGGNITVSAFAKETVVVFQVQDTGVGMEKKDVARIFERFYKADKARSGGGTGLGLSISRHLIESHGGEIWAESEAGAGSTFFFSLPCA